MREKKIKMLNLTKELKFPVHCLQPVKETVKGKRSTAGGAATPRRFVRLGHSP